MKKINMRIFLLIFVLIVGILSACSNSTQVENNKSDNESNESVSEESSKEPIKIGILAAISGPVEDYATQTVRGIELGIDYITDGSGIFNGHPIEYIIEDTEMKPEVAVQKATKLLEDDKVDFLIGSTSSPDTIAVLPLAEEYETIMIVEPAVADSITGSLWNKYIFKTSRNSSQDAISIVRAIENAKSDAKVATLVPDNTPGHDAIAALSEAIEASNSNIEIIHNEIADPEGTDFTSNIQKIINAEPDYLFSLWPGMTNTPFNQIRDMALVDRGIKLTFPVGDFATMRTMQDLFEPGSFVGATFYYHELPDNPIHDWLLENYQEKYNDFPDVFVPGGMTAILAIAKALTLSDGETDPEILIPIMEGMEFETPTGTFIFREEDHQALMTMYVVKMEHSDTFGHPVPVLIEELTPEMTEPPIRNNR